MNISSGTTERIDLTKRGRWRDVNRWSFHNEGSGTAIISGRLKSSTGFGSIGEVGPGELNTIETPGLIALEVEASGGDVVAIVEGEA